MKIRRLSIRLLVALCILTILNVGALNRASAATIDIEVGANLNKPVGWCAAPASVSTIFANQTIPEGTILYYWNDALQQYTTITYDFGAWSNPSFQFSSGRGFYILSPTNYTFTLNYSQRTDSSFNIQMETGKWYWLTYAWNLGNGGSWLEEPWNSQYYGMYPHLNWPGGCNGDTVLWTFDGTDDYHEYDRYAECSRKWYAPDLLSPWFFSRWDQPFWYYNSTGSTRTWQQVNPPYFP